MKAADGAALVALAALWGAAFLFMRIAAPPFGPPALVFVRVAGAAAVLLPLLLWRGQGALLRRHWRPIAVVGLLNSALPFVGFSLAALVLPAGLSAIVNATTPIWAALVAWAWLGARPAALRALGLALGLAGVAALVLSKAGAPAVVDGPSPLLAMAACVAAAACYGLAANFAQQRLAGVPSLVLAAGSQIAATAALAVPAWWAWPTATPPAAAWAAAAALALACTGLAYLLYFRLIARIGPAGASSVTFLIPLFAVGWGTLFLDEALTAPMLAGGAVILLGTALATGVIGPGRRRA